MSRDFHRCKCGEYFWSCEVNGMRWRSHPSKAEPIRQWGRENLPPKWIVVDPDMLYRRYGEDRAVMLEVMTDRPPANRNRDVVEHVQNGGKIEAGWLRLIGGNVPSPLQHWPVECNCGCIDPEVVASEVRLGGRSDDGYDFDFQIPSNSETVAAALVMLLDRGWGGIQERFG